MPDIHKNFSTISLRPSATISEALRLMADNRPGETRLHGGIVLVIDDKRRLLGITTDGDLRRALAYGKTTESLVGEVMNKKAFFIEGPRSSSEILSAATQKIREEGWLKGHLDKIIIVDKENRVIDLVSFFDLWQASDVRFKQIGVVGLGYVGLTLGLTLADIGFTVRGTDTNPRVAETIKKKKSPFFEEGIDALLKDHVGTRFAVVPDFKGKNNCDVYFIAVGTPLDKKNLPSLAYIKKAAENLGNVLKQGDTVILRSTVPLGTTRDVVAPILEKKSGLRAGEEFFVAFAPERTIEGKALQELRTLPQVVGGFNRAGANIAANIFSLMTDTVFLVDTLEEAEIVKLINNTYRDVTFAFANETARICRRWGIDTNKVIHAANAGYARSAVPKPSPGVGGYCLEKDPFIFIETANRKGYFPELFHQARKVNKEIVKELAGDIAQFLSSKGRAQKNEKIFILGFAFKGIPPTSDMRGSPTISLVKELQKIGHKNIFGFDPLVMKDEISSLGVRTVRTLKEGFKDARAVIIMHNHPALGTLRIRELLVLTKKESIFFDTWALYGRDEVAKVPGVQYKRL